MSPLGAPIEAGFLVRLVSLLSRPGLTMARSGGEERSGATRSHAQRAAPFSASMARMASTGPSPE
jgi:hypothetical protein